MTVREFQPRPRRPEDRLRTYNTPIADFTKMREFRQRVMAHIERSEQLRAEASKFANLVMDIQSDVDQDFQELKYELGPMARSDPDYHKLRTEKSKLGRLHSRSMDLFVKALEMEADAMRIVKIGDPTDMVDPTEDAQDAAVINPAPATPVEGAEAAGGSPSGAAEVSDEDRALVRWTTREWLLMEATSKQKKLVAQSPEVLDVIVDAVMDGMPDWLRKAISDSG